MDHEKDSQSDQSAQSSQVESKKTNVDSGGGAYVRGKISTSGGKFVGRDTRKTRLEAGATYIENAFFNRDRAGVINDGFSVLLNVLHHSSIQEVVIAYQTDFSTISLQIVEINHLKRLHDIFHRLEPENEQIRLAVQSLPGNASAWSTIRRHKYSLTSKVQELLDISAFVPFSGDVLMVEQLQELIEQLNLVFETDPSTNPNKAMEHMENMLSILQSVFASHPKTINDRLCNIVRSLQLDKIIDGMANVQNLQGISDSEFEFGNYFQNAQEEIAQLAKELRSASEAHNKLQAIVNELCRMVVNLNMRELRISWKYLDKLSDSLDQDLSPSWVTSIHKTKNNLTQALETGQTWEAEDKFWDYQSQISRYFRDMDAELLSLTNELRYIGGALDRLLDFLGGLT